MFFFRREQHRTKLPTKEKKMDVKERLTASILFETDSK